MNSLSWRGADGHRIEASARHGHREGAGRRRAVPGPEGAARAELAARCRSSRADIDADRADARAPRSLRLSAAARRGRLSRPHLLHRRHAGSLPHRAAGLRPDPGRGRGEREPARVLEAHAGAAALHRGRRLPRHLAAAAGRLRPADAGCRAASKSSSSTPATCSARPTRASASTAGRSSSAAISAASTARAAGSDDGRGSRLPARRVDLRQPRARARRRRSAAGAR